MREGVTEIIRNNFIFDCTMELMDQVAPKCLADGFEMGLSQIGQGPELISSGSLPKVSAPFFCLFGGWLQNRLWNVCLVTQVTWSNFS